MLTTEQRDYLLPAAYNAAIRAGAAIMEIYEHTSEYGVEFKTDNTPITVADRNAHNVIRLALGKTHVPLLSEEGREMLYDERRGWDLFWIVDPLDGTKEFIKGNGEFTVNIALLADNRPELSVIYVPHLHKMYFCDTQRGAFLVEDVAPADNADFTLDEMLRDAKKLPLVKERNAPFRIALSRSHNTDETFRYVEAIMRHYPDAEIVHQGSSYKFCILAEGAVDCYVRTTPTSEWDIAAGEVLLACSGGKMYSWPDKEPMQYNKLDLQNPGFVCLSKFMPEI